jgi:prepilin signal peptidase PulO-like enzyme (type II secretory pathway)
MFVIILVILGLCTGSFVNALTWRLHAKKDWVKGRSECTHCHQALAPADLIPVFSWAWLHGRCRYCHKKIDDNPLVELVLPALFIFSYVYWPLPWNGEGITLFVFWLIFLVGFMALAVYDLRWLLLPNKIVYPLLVLALLQVLLMSLFFHGGMAKLGAAGLGLLIDGGLFYGLFQLSKGRWIGGGDVKLGALLGLIVGGPGNALLLLFLASLFGTLVAVPLLATGKAGRTSRLPFGPFLLAAAVVVYLFGSTLIHWYKTKLLLY